MADPVTDVLFGVGGAVVGGLTTWAVVAGKVGSIIARLDGQDARADRHEKQDDERFERIDGKLDRVLDALAGNDVLRRHPRPAT